MQINRRILNPLSKSDFILLMAWALEKNGQSLKGRAEIQKLAFILHESFPDMNCPFIFESHYLGPFSYELLQELRYLSRRRILNEKMIGKLPNIDYKYHLTSEGSIKVQNLIEVINIDFLNDFSDSIVKINGSLQQRQNI
ncbi:MAG: hypothetical protein ACFFCQ_03900 [Promethearchaeota archaeon]